MSTVPNPATKSGASVGEGAQRAGGLAGRLPAGRARTASDSTSSGFDTIGGWRGIWMAPDGKRGWAIGVNTIFQTQDGGKTWLFVIGSVQVERSEENPAASPTSTSA
jgi:hypothetical protein